MKIKGIAHRGYAKHHTENTLPAFQAALDLNYTHLELDVQLTRDEVPVILHDTTLDRVSAGSGRVKDYTLAELKELRLKNGEQIPTLQEALELLKDRIIVDIELKQMGDLYPGLEKIVLQAVKDNDMLEQSFIASFDHYALERVRSMNAKIDLGIINSGASPALFALAKELRANYISINHRYITDSLLTQCEQEQVILIPYTINQEEEMKRYKQWQSVLICTDELESWAKIYTNH
ncbi:glycerophosphodiester phosphodiesterase [Paenibacillus senegalensis]|uniref:glycerophosphodiester phosphodiesterase n=1 Tax=Paenibacillus senegalensis TaxID=1465766 RepID=UPI000289C3DF|nr:glycerophosphodiester phosphodiesterase family protein [Paenibacillus senegalensis]